MASSINAALTIIGASGSANLDGRTVINDRYIVVDVDGVAASRQAEALATVGLPQLGDAHSVSTFLFVSEVSSRTLSKDSSTIWEVLITYSFPPSGSSDEDTGSTTSFGGSVSSVQTTQFFTGSVFDDMVVGTLDRDKVPTPAGAPTAVPKQTPIVNKLVPQFVINSSRKESSNPSQTIIDFVGRLNSLAVTINGQLFGVKTLFCTRITASTQDDGDTFLVNYEFQYRDDWDVEVSAIDPDTGSPYQNLKNIASGMVSYQLYPTANFVTLSL